MGTVHIQCRSEKHACGECGLPGARSECASRASGLLRIVDLENAEYHISIFYIAVAEHTVIIWPIILAENVASYLVENDVIWPIKVLLNIIV